MDSVTEFLPIFQDSCFIVLITLYDDSTTRCYREVKIRKDTLKQLADLEI